MRLVELKPLRFELVWSGIAGLLALALAWVPLFNLLGYEFAEVYCFFLTISTGAISLRRLSDGTIHLGRQSVGESVVALLARSALPLVLPLGVMLLNGLRVPNCDPVNGLLLYLLLPGCTVPVAVAIALAVSAVARRTAVRVVLYVGVILLSAILTGLHLLLEPPIYAFHPTFGYIAGSIYDEALELPDGLLFFRLMCLALIAAVLAGLEVGIRRRQSRPIAPPFVVLAVAVSIWLVLYQFRFELRIEADRGDIIEALGGQLETAHFVVYYPLSDSRIAQDIQAIAQDHEYRYEQYRRFFGVEPELPIRSFLYSNHEQKARYMGAGRTLIARPWLGEMHLTWDGVGEGHMAHELAHLFTQPFGSGPLRLAGGGLVGLDMGLVEGAAEAGAWDADLLTFHGWSAALHRLDLAPDLDDIMGAGGFWRQHSRTGYTLMGSFCRWLIDRFGMERFRRLYATGDFEDSYGQTLSRLLDDWQGYLSLLPLDQADLDLARFLYDRPSIFGKRCARSLAARTERGRTLAEGYRYAEAAECLQNVVDDDPVNPTYRLELGLYLCQSRQFDRARQVASSVYHQEGTGRVVRARAAELLGDIAWWEGNHEQALQLYQEIAREPLPDGDLRRVTVKRWGLTEESLTGLVFDLLLAAPTPPNAPMIQRLTELAAGSGSPLPSYLLGLQLFNARDYGRAATYLEMAVAGLAGRGEALERGGEAVVRNARLRWGQSLFLSGHLEEARRRFVELGRMGGDPAVDGQVVEALDWADRCRWAQAQGGGGLDVLLGP